MDRLTLISVNIALRSKIFEIKIRKPVNWKFAVKEIGSIDMMESVFN